MKVGDEEVAVLNTTAVSYSAGKSYVGQISWVSLHVQITVASLIFISGYGWGLARFRGVIFPCIQLANQRLSTLFCPDRQLHLHSVFPQPVN